MAIFSPVVGNSSCAVYNKEAKCKLDRWINLNKNIESLNCKPEATHPGSCSEDQWSSNSPLGLLLSDHVAEVIDFYIGGN